MVLLPVQVRRRGAGSSRFPVFRIDGKGEAEMKFGSKQRRGKDDANGTSRSLHVL